MSISVSVKDINSEDLIPIMPCILSKENLLPEQEPIIDNIMPTITDPSILIGSLQPFEKNAIGIPIP